MVYKLIAAEKESRQEHRGKWSGTNNVVEQKLHLPTSAQQTREAYGLKSKGTGLLN